MHTPIYLSETTISTHNETPYLFSNATLPRAQGYLTEDGGYNVVLLIRDCEFATTTTAKPTQQRKTSTTKVPRAGFRGFGKKIALPTAPPAPSA
jgi:hypothetical protein